MKPLHFFIACALGGCGGSQSPSAPPVPREVAANQLRAVADFDIYGDRADRSRALFAEMSRVILHPRCANCHPAGDAPTQRSFEPHYPAVQRGPENRGVVGMECSTCHQDRNQPLTRVPGAHDWHLAPIEMAWQGKSMAQICAQLKDPARNGGKTLAKLVEHNTNDKLVSWGWAPGADREPAPGTQQEFGALTAAWVETGAECPLEVVR